MTVKWFACSFNGSWCNHKSFIFLGIFLKQAAIFPTSLFIYYIIVRSFLATVLYNKWHFTLTIDVEHTLGLGLISTVVLVGEGNVPGECVFRNLKQLGAKPSVVLQRQHAHKWAASIITGLIWRRKIRRKEEGRKKKRKSPICSMFLKHNICISACILKPETWHLIITGG